MNEIHFDDMDHEIEHVTTQWHGGRRMIEIHLDDWILTISPVNALSLARCILQTIESAQAMADVETQRRWQSGFSPN